MPNRHLCFVVTSAFALAIAALETPAAAQDSAADSTLSPEAQSLQAQLDIATRQKDLAEARAALLEARIGNLNLPNFENTSTLSGDGAGKLEIGIIGAKVIKTMATTIANDLSNDETLLLLTADEEIPFADALAIDRQIDARAHDLRSRIQAYSGTDKAGFIGIVGTGFAALKAASGIFSTETTLSTVGFSASERLLLDLVLAEKPNARRHDSKLTIEYGRSDDEKHVFNRFSKLEALVTEAGKAKMPVDTASDDQKKKWAQLQASIATANLLIKTLNTPDSTGKIPLFNAARFIELFGKDPKIVRIRSELSAGSYISKNNFATRYLRGDPAKMYAGMVASYTVVDPSDGKTEKAALIECRSAQQSLRTILSTSGPDWTLPKVNCQKVETD